MSFDTPIHELVLELLDHGIPANVVAEKLEMTYAEIASAIHRKVPFHIYTRFVPRPRKPPKEPKPRKVAPPKPVRPQTLKAWWEEQPDPKASYRTFCVRVGKGFEREDAILEVPKTDRPLAQIWREHPNPSVGLTSFLSRVARGMTVEEALTSNSHMNRLPRIEGKAISRWYADFNGSPACCMDVFQRRTIEGMDPMEAITTPAQQGFRAYKRGPGNTLHALHRMWVASGKKITYRRALQKYRDGASLEDAVKQDQPKGPVEFKYKRGETQ